MNNILNITDLDKLTITKVKSFAIYFTYDNERYMLHEEIDGYYGYMEICKRILNEHGSVVKVEYLDTVSGYRDLEYVHQLIRPVKLKQSTSILKLGIKLGNYKLIDKEYFVRQLTKYGYIHSLFEEEE